MYSREMLQKPIFKRKRCKDRPSPYKCHCGKSYQTKDALSKHKKDIHKETSPDKKQKKFEGQKGRPSLKKHESNQSRDYESSLMEEEIYEKTLSLLLETEILLAQFKKSNASCWNKCLDFYNNSELPKVFEKNQISDFNIRHQENVVEFLNKNMPTKQEVFRF